MIKQLEKQKKEELKNSEKGNSRKYFNVEFFKTINQVKNWFQSENKLKSYLRNKFKEPAHRKVCNRKYFKLRSILTGLYLHLYYCKIP